MNVKINSEYITLGQLLKHVNLISTGGQAKEFISVSQIEVNGAAVIQRGKKLYPGDIVNINNSVFTITR